MSSSVSVAGEWDLLGDRFYRKSELYPLHWSTATTTSGSTSSALRLDLRDHIVAAAPFGGPIAAVRDDSKLVQLQSEPSRRRLLIFSASGRLLSSAHWPTTLAHLHSLSWSHNLLLLALLSNSSLLRFRLRSAQQAGPTTNLFHSLMGPAANLSVSEAAFFSGGVAVLGDDNRTLAVCLTDADTPEVRKLADPGIGDEEQVLCMAVIEPQFVMSGNPEVLIAVGERVVSVDEDVVQVLGVGLGIGPVQKMAVSPNGKLLAAFASGRLLVITSDFSRFIFEYECEVSVQIVAARIL